MPTHPSPPKMSQNLPSNLVKEFKHIKLVDREADGGHQTVSTIPVSTPIPSPLSSGSHPSAPDNYLDVDLNQSITPKSYESIATLGDVCKQQTLNMSNHSDNVRSIAITSTVDASTDSSRDIRKANMVKGFCQVVANITPSDVLMFTQLCHCVGKTAHTLGPYVKNCDRFWPYVSRLMAESGHHKPGGKPWRVLFTEHMTYYKMALKYIPNNTDAIYPYFSIIHAMDLSQSLPQKSYNKIKAIRDAVDRDRAGIAGPVVDRPESMVSDAESREITRFWELFGAKCAPLNRESVSIESINVEQRAPEWSDQTADPISAATPTATPGAQQLEDISRAAKKTPKMGTDIKANTLGAPVLSAAPVPVTITPVRVDSRPDVDWWDRSGD